MPKETSKYKDEYAEQAFKLCLLGHTNEELAEYFCVHVDTIHEWRKVHPAFSDAVKKGKADADGEIAHSLYRRARGVEITKEVVINGEVHEVTDKLPPDPTSMIFWLKNRQPKKWRDKQETALTNGEGSEPFRLIIDK